MTTGEVSEWPIEHAWKACIPRGIEGSNTSLSATKTKTGPDRVGFFIYSRV